MLTVDRPLHPIMNSSRIYRGVPKPAVDYLARNKRAAKKPPRGTATKQSTQQDTRKPNNTKQQARQSSKTKAQPQDVNTVTISKSYLENLLRSNVAPQNAASNTAPQNTGSSNVAPQIKLPRKEVNHVHVEVDSSQVPGLGSPVYTQGAHPHSLTAPQQAHPHNIAAPHQVHHNTAPSHQAYPHNINAPPESHPHNTTATQNNTPLTAKEQWLKDLAKQVKEKKERQLQKQVKNEDQPEEVYFPFGRPGCGAPIRTDSGEVLADLRSKVRTSIEGPVQQAAPKQTRGSSPTQEYFPFGKPGCGAPNNTASHGVSYQPYGADIPQASTHPYQAYNQPAPQQPIANSQPLNWSHPSNYPQSIPQQNTFQPQQSQVEDYYPFGRPGGGAPMNTQPPYTRSTKPPQSHPSHPSQVSHPSQATHPHPSHAPHPPPAPQAHTTPQHAPSEPVLSPREGFGRGAGPYVDKYVLQDMDQRRRKEMEYRAGLAEQIAAKQREKEAKRLAKEREEALEEAKLEQERQRLNAQHQRELQEKRRKEELAMQRHKLNQQKIEQAKESAIVAKMNAKGHSHPTPSTYSPSHTTHSLHNTTDQNKLSLSSKFDSVLRSPSMLQLQAQTQPEPENSKKASRIPVRRPNNVNATPRRTVTLHVSTNRESTSKQASTYQRPPSPPIPTLTKKIGHQSQYDTTAHYQARAVSPPVPTLAKRIPKSYDAVSSTLPSLVERSEQSSCNTRPGSPPVPTLRKKMSHEQLRRSHDREQVSHDQMRRSGDRQMISLDIHVGPGLNDQVRSQSPPVPTLAKRLSKPNVLQNTTSIKQPSPVGTIPINRLPSVEPVRDRTPTLPAIVPVMNEHQDHVKTEGGPSRQQVILEQLAALKKGILSHQTTIDQRVNHIMTRKRPQF